MDNAPVPSAWGGDEAFAPPSDPRANSPACDAVRRENHLLGLVFDGNVDPCSQEDVAIVPKMPFKRAVYQEDRQSETRTLQDENDRHEAGGSSLLAPSPANNSPKGVLTGDEIVNGDDDIDNGCDDYSEDGSLADFDESSIEPDVEVDDEPLEPTLDALPVPSAATRSAAFSFIAARMARLAPDKDDEACAPSPPPRAVSVWCFGTTGMGFAAPPSLDTTHLPSLSFFSQGRRDTMEDKWVVVEGLLGPDSWWAAVFDGHGGDEASAYLADGLTALHKQVASKLGAGRAAALADDDVVRRGLLASFLATDASLVQIMRASNCTAGSTGTTVLKIDQRLYCANVGDSRTVLCRGVRGKGEAWVSAHPLSEDHKPTRADEKARIKLRGGVVSKGAPHGGARRVTGLRRRLAQGEHPRSVGGRGRRRGSGGSGRPAALDAPHRRAGDFARGPQS